MANIIPGKAVQYDFTPKIDKVPGTGVNPVSAALVGFGQGLIENMRIKREAEQAAQAKDIAMLQYFGTRSNVDLSPATMGQQADMSLLGRNFKITPRDDVATTLKQIEYSQKLEGPAQDAVKRYADRKAKITEMELYRPAEAALALQQLKKDHIAELDGLIQTTSNPTQKKLLQDIYNLVMAEDQSDDQVKSMFQQFLTTHAQKNNSWGKV